MRKLVVLVSLVVVGGCASEPGPDADSGLQEVTFNMAWLPQGSMSGVLVAIDQGLYRDAGLDVSAVRGFGGIRTVNEARHDINIAQGLGANPHKDNAEYKYAGPDGVIVDVSERGWVGTGSFIERVEES